MRRDGQGRTDAGMTDRRGKSIPEYLDEIELARNSFPEHRTFYTIRNRRPYKSLPAGRFILATLLRECRRVKRALNQDGT